MAGVKKTASFEDYMNRLDRVAVDMEKGEMPLEKLMSLYEEGMALAASLRAKLEQTQTRMQEIKAGQDGKPVVVDAEPAQQTSLLED